MAWLSGWGKRKKITLTGGLSGAQTDYQVKLAVTYDSDMQTDFDDLRFTKLDGTTLLDAWLESKIDSTSAVVWVETDTPANGVDADIYMYYGNSGASSNWDIETTFLLGDDFPGSSIDTGKWDGKTSNAAVSGGIMSYGGDGTQDPMHSITQFGANIACRSKIKFLTPASYINYFGFADSVMSHYSRLNIVYNGSNRMRTRDGATISNVDTNNPLDTWVITDINVLGGTNVSWFYDDVEGTNSPKTTNPPNANDLEISWLGRSTSACIQSEWIIVRKYVANPPTYGFGGEESMAWLSGWGKRKKITLTGGLSGAQTDYQVKLAVTYDSDMQTDFDDLRFTNVNGRSLIDAWLEEKTDGVSATVWVEFPTTPANTLTTDYYMYYGNSGVSNVWDGSLTFSFFDDFPGSSLDTTNNWELVNTPLIDVSGGILTIDNDAVSEYIRSKSYTAPVGSAIRTKARDYTAAQYPGNYSFGERTSGSNVSTVAKATYTADEYALATNDGVGSESLPRLNIYSDDSYHLWDITWLSNEAKLIKDGLTLGTNTLQIPSGSLKIVLGGQSTGGSYYGNTKGSYDWVLVRKYAANPATYGFGGEESEHGNSYWYYNLLKRRN